MPEPSTIAIIVSAAALSVSLVTMWITLFRRGSLKMTQPTTVMFGPDGRHHEGDPKKFSASTSIFDSKTRTRNRKYVCKSFTWRTPTELSNLGTRQRETFSGYGIFVGDQGVVADHHFLLPPDAERYVFKAGEYRLEVFGRIVGAREATVLWSNSLIVSESDARMLTQAHNAIYFDWGPDSNRYITSIRSKPPAMTPEELFGKGLPASPKADERANA